MRYSILLATLGRTQEVRHFLTALSRQSLQDFEVLIIDQNRDGRLDSIVESFSRLFPLQRLLAAPGHSRALNTGLPHARGEFVAFPDDDCWYSPDLLHRVAHMFTAHPECAGISGREIVEPGFTTGGRWDSRQGLVTRHNIWRRAISFSVFLRRSVAQQYRFDESLGVGAGTPWGAGEETDYLLRLLADGHGVLYDPSITIWHQGRSGPYTRETHAKAHKYGMGMGRVLRKNQYSSWSVGYYLARPLGGAAHALLTGYPGQARYHWSVFSGRLSGWRLAPESPSALAPSVLQSRLNSKSEDLSS